MTYCVGLTGGIGSGKSSAARIFGSLGAGVVDVDDISHALTRPGGAAIAAIRSMFGADAIAPDGSLDRARMRELVFGNSSAKHRLEAILHPLIGSEVRAHAARATQPYVMLVVPLLLERNAYRELISRVAVVDCSEAQQIQRTMRRSAITEEAVRAIMAAQLPRAERVARADDVLHNEGGEDELRRQVTTLHAHYLELARAHRASDRGDSPAADIRD
jgi:dephospho-CoA kinase